MRVVLFDFDGVLMNSVQENVYTAYNGFTEETVTTPEGLPRNFTNRLLQFRHFVRPAGEYLVLVELLLESEEPVTEARWEERRSFHTPKLKENIAKYFEARRRFQSVDMERWLSLHTVYEPLFSFAARLPADQRRILTNKDRLAVIQLCHHFGWKLEDQHILSGDGGRKKEENRKTLPEGEYLFIEDQLKNLFEVSDVSRAMVSWGYSVPEERAEAVSRGVPVIEGDGIEEFITRFLGGTS